MSLNIRTDYEYQSKSRIHIARNIQPCWLFLAMRIHDLKESTGKRQGNNDSTSKGTDTE